MSKHEEYVAATKQLISDVMEHTLDEYLRNDQLGSMNFSDIDSQANDVLQLLADIATLPVHLAPMALLEHAYQRMQTAKDTLNSMRGFDIRQQDAVTRHARLIKNFTAFLPDFFSSVLTLFNYLHWRTDAPKAVMQELEVAGAEKMQQLDAMMTSVANAQQTAEATQQELSRIKTEAEAAATMTAGISHSSVFGETANQHARFQKWWLFFSVASALGTAGAVVWLFADSLLISTPELIPTDTDGPVPGSGVDWPQTLARSTLIIIGLAIVSLCTKNYRAHRHLHVINLHRSNALRSFEAFVRMAQDEQVRDAVLLEAARCIYRHQPTGYVGQAADGGDARIFEVMKLARDPGRA